MGRKVEEKMKERKILSFEPYFFMFFGMFHLHRIWGLIDRNSYARFWLGVLKEKGILYYGLMGILAILCVLGIITFFKNRNNNYWWRWIYVFGGMYVLFDLFAIAVGLNSWNMLLLWMFDVSSPYWNIVCSFFILLGGFVFVLGIKLLRKRKKQLPVFRTREI